MTSLKTVRFGRHRKKIVAPPPPSMGPAKIIGLNSNFQDNTYLQDARDLGVDSVRVELWNNALPRVEGNATTPAEAKAVLNSKNISMLPLVTAVADWGSPLWEQSAVAAIAQADLGVIEIGNEPFMNTFGFPNRGYRRPVDYATMVLRCADAVNAASGGTVKVLAAAGGPINGVDGVVAAVWPTLDYTKMDGSRSTVAGNGGWIKDIQTALPSFESRIAGWTIHPYQISGSGPGFITSVEQATTLPLWVTEAGFQVTDEANSTQQTAKTTAVSTYTDTYLLSGSHQWRAFYWYNHKDYVGYDSTGHPDAGWALVNVANTKVPAWAAFKAATARVRNYRNPQPPAERTTWTELNTPLGAGQVFQTNPVDIHNATYVAAAGADPSTQAVLTSDQTATLAWEVSDDAVTWTQEATTSGTSVTWKRAYSGYPYGRFKVTMGGTPATQTKLTIAMVAP